MESIRNYYFNQIGLLPAASNPEFTPNMNQTALLNQYNAFLNQENQLNHNFMSENKYGDMN